MNPVLKSLFHEIVVCQAGRYWHSGYSRNSCDIMEPDIKKKSGVSSIDIYSTDAKITKGIMRKFEPYPFINFLLIH